MTSRLERVMTGNTFQKYITQTSTDVSGSTRLDGERILFSEPYAWCVSKSTVPLQEYKEYAEIDLRGEYLIYSLKVNGYQKENLPPTSYMTDNIKIEYAVVVDEKKVWAFYKGGEVSENCLFS